MSKYRKDFPVYKSNPNLIYLDSAASALKVNKAIDLMFDYYNTNGANVHRGAYKLSMEATNMYDHARLNVAKFINASENEIVFTKGATHSLNMVANHYLHTLKKGDEVIVSELEHHASLLPFINACEKTGATLKYVKLDKSSKITVENFKKVLTKNTKIVSLTLISNVLGYLTPMKEIIKLSHEVDAKVLVDAAQAISQMKVDVKDLNADYLSFSAHKIYGPNGIGVLYGKKELLDTLTPLEFGGEMVLSVSHDEIVLMDSPMRLEAGTPPIADAIGLSGAIDYINEITYDEIIHVSKELKERALNKLKAIKEIIIYNETSDAAIITFNVNNIHPHDIASYLDGKSNIALRAGKHCAHLVSQHLDTSATLRVSFNIYNTIKDVDVFIDTLIEAINFFNGGF